MDHQITEGWGLATEHHLDCIDYRIDYPIICITPVMLVTSTDIAAPYFKELRIKQLTCKQSKPLKKEIIDN